MNRYTQLMLLLVLTLAFSTTESFLLAAEPAVEADDEQDKIVRELELEHPLPRQRGNALKPTVVEDADELAELFTGEALRKEVLEQVDLESHRLLLFAWAGSGQDRLSVELVDGDATSVEFRLKRGLTRDLRPHSHLFAIDREVKWKVVTVRR